MKSRDRLRIAMQKSGRLAEPSRDLLTRCGLKFRESRDRLFCFGEVEPVDLLLVRDDDIPGLIASGVCDLGIVGRNVLLEQQLAAKGDAGFTELRALGFGQCRLSLAIAQEETWTGPAQLAGQRIATSYPSLLGDWLARNGVAATIVELAGSVEIAPRLGTAEIICDLVSSGATLAANQLKEADIILQSESVLAGPAKTLIDERGDLLALLLARLDSVIQVRESKLVLLHAPRHAIEHITALLPNAQRPTLMPLEGGDDHIALQALCTGAVTWRHLEELKRAGASSLLVLPVEKMLS
ncbi:MAG: ATP phosphoribosyltransferase [Dokdonella sp.]